ncbi:hypothetical protein DV735_g3837, partial [Chaetothyriales sp. CBS 134920]
MMRNKPSTMQKTYDEAFLACSTAVFFEGQNNEPEALRSWRIALDHLSIFNAHRMPYNYTPKSETEKALFDSIKKLELQCRERVDLLESLKRSRLEAEEEAKRADREARDGRKRGAKAKSRNADSPQPGWLGNDTVPPISYSDLSYASPALPPPQPLPSLPSRQPSNGSVKDPAASLHNLNSSSGLGPTPLLPVPQKASSRSPSPDSHKAMRTTLRSDNKKRFRSSRPAAQRTTRPAPVKAAGLAWDSRTPTGRPESDATIEARLSATAARRSLDAGARDDQVQMPDPHDFTVRSASSRENKTDSSAGRPALPASLDSLTLAGQRSSADEPEKARPPIRHAYQSTPSLSTTKFGPRSPPWSNKTADAPTQKRQDPAPGGRADLPPVGGKSGAGSTSSAPAGESDSDMTQKTTTQTTARSKKLLKNLPRGMDLAAARSILNEVIVRGDEVHWDDVAGLDLAKTALKEAVVYPFLRPDLFMGLREPARGMLLFGPPGTGKTMLARAVATESRSTFFAISASSLTSKWHGESEKLVRALFGLAKVMSPSIIFVDEIDSLLSKRGDNSEHEASRRSKTEFLIQWSDLQRAAAGKDTDKGGVGDPSRVLVLAATNCPWDIDDAARRRFVRRQYIPLPEADTREKQLRTLLGHQKHGLAADDISRLVELTDGYSGSDITALAKDAAMGPLRNLGEALLFTPPEKIRPIQMADFEKSLESIRPSVNKAGLDEFDKWAKEFGERAGQAYEFGSGANAALGGQQPGGAPAPAYGTYSSQQDAAGYPQGGYQQNPAAVQQGSTPMYGHSDLTGYQAPTAAYPSTQQQPPQQQPGSGGIPALTQQFGHMDMSQKPLLYPTDLNNQPFNVAELDYPPPPAILPVNTSVTPSPGANCPPKFVRSTLNAVPTTHSLLKKSKLPFALVIQPYTSLHDNEDPVPVVPDQIISRCRRCRSYINPFVTFLDHGHRWRCNICNLTNDVPQAFDWDSVAQKALDRWQRPDLNYGVVEFVAPQEYMVRPPQPLVYLFLIDVSYAAVTSGLLATTARCIRESLDRIPNTDRRTRLGFIAVDSSLHFFNIPRDDSENIDTSMLVVSDLDEPFLPTPADLLVTLTEARGKIEALLDKLQDMFQNNQNAGSAMGSALRAGHKLIGPVGGKMTVVTASLPNIGHGKLEVREDKKLLGTSKESSLLGTANSFYKSFAVECSKQQISVDMFLFSSQYQDVASLSNLPRYTGGQTFFYPGWNAAREDDAFKFAHEFSDYLSTEIGLEAVLRVRATTGLRMSTFYGNFFNRSSDLCAFPAFPRDQAYVVEVAIDETITKSVVCMQTAVLHTTCNGERRIRVLTLALPTTQVLSDVYASADQQAITTYYSHKAVERTLSNGLESARDMIQAKLIELLQTYKKELAGGSMGGGSLQFPANLRALPVLFLALIKNLGLRKSSQIPTDMRSAALCLLSTLPLPLLIQYIYPKMYSLHDMPDDAGTVDESTGEIVLPPPSNLSSERLVPYGLYLIDDGQTQFLWVGRDAVPQLVSDVFGLADKSQLKVGKQSLPELDNDFNERVRAVVSKSRDHRSRGVGSIIIPHLYIVKEDGEPGLRLWAQTMLVEDRADQGVSLTQWMGMLRERASS